MGTERLDAGELRRLSTWAGAVAQHLRPEAPIALTPEGLRLGRKGSLAISAADGSWFDHEAGKGGRDALSLIRHLKNCNAAEATAWARDWLDTHPGDGELNAEGAAEAAAEAGERRSAWARQILDEAIDPIDTPAAAYLESRGIASYPSCVRFLPDARTGEGAVVGILTTATGEMAGVQLGYVDPAGRKSTVQPHRQLFLIEKNDQAAFRISAAEPAEDAVPLAIAEGLEDALSIARSGAAHAVIGIPGIGRFGKFDLPAATEVVVFRDGDAIDSEATTQLTSAVNRWVLARVRIRITDTPAGADANSILQDKGVDELRRLMAEAAPAELSLEADIIRLAALEPAEYERQRIAAARRHGLPRVGFLDTAVKVARSEQEAAAADEDEDEAPHPESVAELAPVLDEALAELQRYVVAAEPDLAAAVLWSLHAHLVHHDKVWLAVSPRLAVQAPDRNCGKSTLLEAIGALVPRPTTGSSVTASVVFRLIETCKPTLLLDEADRILRSSNDELIAVLNSSHRRAGAFVWRTEEVAGQRVPVKFSTWSPCAFWYSRATPDTAGSQHRDPTGPRQAGRSKSASAAR